MADRAIARGARSGSVLSAPATSPTHHLPGYLEHPEALELAPICDLEDALADAASAGGGRRGASTRTPRR